MGPGHGGALVVEDDYDSEFRYDVGSLPALHSMDPDVIVYLGTASKVLATAFGAGWLVAPPALVDQLAALADHGSACGSPSRCSTPSSRCSARATWNATSARCAWSTPAAAPRSSRDSTAERRAGSVPFRLLGDTAGIHVVLELPGDYPAARLVEAAAERGVRVYPLDRYYAGSRR